MGKCIFGVPNELMRCGRRLFQACWFVSPKVMWARMAATYQRVMRMAARLLKSQTLSPSVGHLTEGQMGAY